MDKLEDALEELAEEEAYHLEALAMLRASSLETLRRVAQVKNHCRRTSVEWI